jgi:hypothetical protein
MLIRGFSTGRNKSFRQNHSVMMRKEYELSMEIPKFGISRLVFFSRHNRMILTDVQYDPPAIDALNDREALTEEDRWLWGARRSPGRSGGMGRDGSTCKMGRL